MVAPNFPSTGLVPNVTTFAVGNLIYLWDGEKWKTITAQLNANQIKWTDSKTVGSNLNDLQGFTDALLEEAGLADTGIDDTVSYSRRLEAIKLICSKETTVESFADLQTLQPEDGDFPKRFVCVERANAEYLLQPSGYVALPGDATFANGRVGKLQIDDVVFANMFGEFGTSDDTAIVRSVHSRANSEVRPVSYVGVSTLNIDADADIDVFTSIDFGWATINPLNGFNTPPLTFGEYTQMFHVYDADRPVVYDATILTDATNLVQGSPNPVQEIFSGQGYARIVCNDYQLPSRYLDGFEPYRQSFNCVEAGKVSEPLSTDLTSYVSSCYVSYRERTPETLKISNINLVRDDSWNQVRFFFIERCNVSVSNVHMVQPSEIDTNCAIFGFNYASDIRVSGLIGPGFVSGNTASIGSYWLNCSYCADIHISNCKILEGWGWNGFSYVNGVYASDFTLNRLDTHQSGHNVYAENGVLIKSENVGGGSGSMQFGWGGGRFVAKNVTSHNSAIVASRPDWGGNFVGGSVELYNCSRINSNGDSTVTMVDFKSYPVGAYSAATALPETIIVSNGDFQSNVSFTARPIELAAKSGVVKPKAPKKITVDACRDTAQNAASYMYVSMPTDGTVDYSGRLDMNISNCSLSRVFFIAGSAINTPTDGSNIRLFVRDLDGYLTLRHDGYLSKAVISKAEVRTVESFNSADIAIDNCAIRPDSASTVIGVKDASTGYLKSVRLNNCNVTAGVNLSNVSAASGCTIRPSVTVTLPTSVVASDFMLGWRDTTIYS